MDPAAALKASALFKGFTETGLSIIAGISAARSYPKGTPLFVESMASDALLIIVAGQVALTSKLPSGEEVSLGQLGPGDFLGELSLIATGQRMCTANAVTPVSVLEIRQADFQKLLGLKPQACMKLLMAIITQFSLKVADNKDALKSLLKP